MTHAVLFSPEAQEDLLSLYTYIAQHSGSRRAFSYVERLTDYCQSFSTFPERGTQRADLRPGLRVIGFASRITIAFHIASQTVVIDRILYAGRALEDELPAQGDLDSLPT
jgi:toxin ParE1/3/4